MHKQNKWNFIINRKFRGFFVYSMTKTNVTSVAVHLKPRDIKYTCAQSIFDDPKALQMGYRKNEETIEIKRLYYM